jgi:hypothetical protein
MSNRITEKDSDRIKILAATGRYTPQEIVEDLETTYTPQQIRAHLKVKFPKLAKQLNREKSRGAVKLKSILTKIFTNVTVHEETHVGEKLRLDFYIEEPYNLGFEYDGIQHKKFTPGLHKTEEDFYNGVERDKRKEELCDGRGISLVRISHDDELSHELVSSRIESAGYGNGHIKDGYLTSTEKYKIKQKEVVKIQNQHRKKQYQQYKNSEAYANNKQRQKEYRKKQYQKSKEFARKVKS